MFNKSYVWCAAILMASGLLQAKVLHISNEEQYNQAVKSNKQLIVEFSADWCSVCNGIRSPFEQIADEKEFSEVAFAQIDVDKLDSISKQNGIVGVPTFVYVENGSKKIEEIGVQNMPAFKDHLRENIRKTFKLVQNDVDMSMSGQPATVTDSNGTLGDQTPVAEPVADTNIFIKILISIKNFIMLILLKIQEFFMMIVDAIKGFFNR